MVAVVGGSAVGTLPSSGMERVEVSSDNWTFRGAESKRPFVPFGVNYTPAWSGWAPDYFADGVWDRAKVERDFDDMARLGVNVVKVAFSYRRTLPDPQAAGDVRPYQPVLDRIDEMLDIAGKRGIRLILTFNAGWHGFPAWYEEGGGWFGPGSHDIVSAFWKRFAREHRGDGRIFAYSFCVEMDNEITNGWKTPEALANFRAWLRREYDDSLERLNAAWKTTYPSWDAIAIPGFDGYNATDWKNHPEGTDANENKTGDRHLYDYLLFREYAQFRFVHFQAQAIKAEDPGALCTMGLIQWQPFLRQIFDPVNEGPIRGPEGNAKEMAKALDCLGIHFYPVLPLGEEQDDIQLGYLELWARYAHAGKPVLLGEFNAGPEDRNARWVERVIRRTRGVVSGWMVWTFQNVQPSDNITEACGLIDAQRRPTALGRRFPRLSAEVQKWKLKRKPSGRIERLDKMELFTSGNYRRMIDRKLFETYEYGTDFAIESNRSIDRLISGAAHHR